MENSSALDRKRALWWRDTFGFDKLSAKPWPSGNKIKKKSQATYRSLSMTLTTRFDETAINDSQQQRTCADFGAKRQRETERAREGEGWWFDATLKMCGDEFEQARGFENISLW
jgi:hypothetical protein